MVEPLICWTSTFSGDAVGTKRRFGVNVGVIAGNVMEIRSSQALGIYMKLMRSL
jgi:hypothetical protein